MSASFRLQAGGQLTGQLRVPGDKSISHRAVMFGAIAEGETEVSGFLDGADCLATLSAFTAMGVKAQRVGTQVRVQGCGLRGLTPPAAALDLGNSGTSMRLMSGIMAGQGFPSTLIGDASLSKRPMRRVVEPLRLMGAEIEASPEGFAPLRISPAAGLHGIRYETPVASAQIKSAVLLAGLYAEGDTEVLEPGLSRDHTERMLRAFGVEVVSAPGRAMLSGGQRLHGTHIQVPGDISSAAFFLVGAAISPGSELLLTGVGMNPTRRGVVEILRAMGADIQIQNERQFGDEPVADLRVRGSELRGIAVPEHLVASAIDEFPAIFVAAACAQGQTRVSGAAELRVKESDRISAMVDGLVALGVDAEGTPDGALINGGGLRGGTIDSHGDHRVAMAFSMAALRSEGEIHIVDCDNVDTSFPGFAALAAAHGLGITVEQS